MAAEAAAAATDQKEVGTEVENAVFANEERGRSALSAIGAGRPGSGPMIATRERFSSTGELGSAQVARWRVLRPSPTATTRQLAHQYFRGQTT